MLMCLSPVGIRAVVGRAIDIRVAYSRGNQLGSLVAAALPTDADQNRLMLVALVYVERIGIFAPRVECADRSAANLLIGVTHYMFLLYSPVYCRQETQ